MIRVNHIKNNKILQYIALSAALLGGFLLLNNSTWIGDSQSHTLIEAVSSIFAFVVGVLALVHFNSKKNNTILFISVAFIGAGFLDLFHAAVTSTFVDFLLPSAAPSLIPWSWNASRTFLAVYLWLSYIFWRREVKLGEAGRVGERTIFGLAGILTIVSFVFFAFVALPPAYFDSLYFHRPEEFVAAGFFLAALVGYLRKGFWKTDTLNHWLILSLIVGFFGQAVFMSTSGQLFDAAFVSAHLLKIVSYLFVVIGLLESMFSIFRQAEERAGNILSINDKLADEILERERVENSLRESEERLKAILYSVNDAIITITEDQNIILFNTGAEKIFLYKPEDIIGQPIETLIPERFRVNHKSHIHEFGKTGVTERGMQPITELVGLKSNGEEFPIDADISRITLGGQLLFTVILRDVTRQRNMEEKIRKSNAELESYATIVSHDLRAPLRALTNYSRFLQEDASEKLDSDDLKISKGS